MFKSRQLTCLVLILAMLFAISATGIENVYASFTEESLDVSTPEPSGKNSVHTEGPRYSSLPADATFAEVDEFIHSDREQWDYINPYYDAYPKTDNTSNFHSHATASYPNVNGTTVTVDTLYRKNTDALNDPNFSMAVLLYQCIKYKMANPSEEVELYFTSFRVSPTAAACLNPNSPYYGYMRALYDSDYDANGFVRIVYLLVEAAKLGINVTMVTHLNSYAVKQYNNETGKTYTKSEPSYIEYFNNRLDESCYAEYAEGDKVSDRLNFCPVEWNMNKLGEINKVGKGSDIVHIKTLSVSHYLDQEGVAHNYGVWFSSTNLDTNNYKGHNGNGNSQAGVIVSGHEAIFRVTKNYVNLISNYTNKEGLYQLRNVMTRSNVEQISLILSGKGDTIPKDKQLVYLGSETDEIFELYFTPIGGGFDLWDTVNNPFCKYLQELYDSEDYAILSWNNAGFDESWFVTSTAVSAIYDKFVTNPNPKNRLNIQCLGAEFEGFSVLKKGENIEFVNVKTSGPVHEKDLIMSYEKDGERRYISILHSLNFNAGAMYLQTNHILVVKETEETGTVVFESIGSKESAGAIVSSAEGARFSSNERRVMSNKLEKLPLTVSATVKLDALETAPKSYGIIFSNSDSWNLSISYEINGKGNPQLVLSTHTVKDGLKLFKANNYKFDKVNVCTGEKIDLTFVINPSESTASCYVGGVFKQTVKIGVSLNDGYIKAQPFVVGGSHLGSNYNSFDGIIYELSVWSDVRDVENKQGKVDTSDSALMAHYEFYGKAQNSFFGDMSLCDNNVRSERLWLGEDEIIEVPDDAYCFAVVGDTQALSYFYPDSMTHVYDWLVENAEEKRIKYVIGVGDVTEMSVKEEYDHAWEQIKKLSGKVNYSVVMGNHDKYDYKSNGYVAADRADFLFNKTFCNETYLAELDGWYGEGDVSCSYKAFSVGETDWLILNLDYGPTDEMLAWAGQVVSAYPNHKVVVVTHAYLYRDGTTLDSSECYPSSDHNSTFNNGDEIFDKFVKKYDNIELVISGHDPWDHVVSSQVKGDNGNTVTQLLIDGQYIDKYYGASEMVALLYFSPDGKTMTVRYYSAAKETYGSALSQFTLELN